MFLLYILGYFIRSVYLDQDSWLAEVSLLDCSACLQQVPPACEVISEYSTHPTHRTHHLHDTHMASKHNSHTASKHNSRTHAVTPPTHSGPMRFYNSCKIWLAEPNSLIGQGSHLTLISQGQLHNPVAAIAGTCHRLSVPHYIYAYNNSSMECHSADIRTYIVWWSFDANYSHYCNHTQCENYCNHTRCENFAAWWTAGRTEAPHTTNQAGQVHIL